jgi:hypothetical protein
MGRKPGFGSPTRWRCVSQILREGETRPAESSHTTSSSSGPGPMESTRLRMVVSGSGIRSPTNLRASGTRLSRRRPRSDFRATALPEPPHRNSAAAAWHRHRCAVVGAATIASSEAAHPDSREYGTSAAGPADHAQSGAEQRARRTATAITGTAQARMERRLAAAGPMRTEPLGRAASGGRSKVRPRSSAPVTTLA